MQLVSGFHTRADNGTAFPHLQNGLTQWQLHFAHIRHPLIGDVLRGDGRQNRFFRENFDCHRLLLASTALTFQHPRHNRAMNLTCPLTEDMREVCVKFGWVDL